MTVGREGKRTKEKGKHLENDEEEEEERAGKTKNKK